MLLLGNDRAGRIRHPDRDRDVVRQVRGEEQLSLHVARRALRPDAQALDVVRDAPLEIDRLPDARERPVPALLAEGYFRERRFRELGRIVGRAVDPDLYLVPARPEMLGDLEREGQEAALVRADMGAVQPDGGIVEHRPEAQPKA